MRIIQNSIVSLFFCTSSFAQQNDFQIWSSFDINDRVTYKTNIYLKHGLRFRENTSLLYKSFSEIKLKYKYDKRISIAIGFRDINLWNKELIYEKANRYYADIYLRTKINRFTFSIRNRYQKQGDVIGYEYIFRQKGSLSYNIRKTKIAPLFSSEYFLNEKKYIDKIRYTLGISYPINKDMNFDLAYRIQQQLRVADPETIFIIVSKLSYDF